jgi:predicted permease
MRAFAQDVLYSLRSLRQARTFTVTAIVTLALGMGASSAIFSVVNAVLLRPVPFPDPGQIVHLAWDAGDHLQWLSALKFQYWHDHARSFAAVATWRSTVAVADAEGGPTTTSVLAVSPDFFDVVGKALTRGRGFTPAEFAPDGANVTIISHAMWDARFARAADLTGRIVRLEGQPVAIVGVLPESFDFPYNRDPIDLIVPLHIAVDPTDAAENWPTVARFRDGVTHEQALAETSALMAGFRTAFPNQVSGGDRGMRLVTFNELYVDRAVQTALWTLMSAVVLVLFIACANVANLFLSRLTERSREIVVRAALGASQARIVRLVFTESVVIAVGAAILGFGLGKWISGILTALSPAEVPRLTSAYVDWRLLLFTAGLSVAVSLLFGTVAAWLAVRLPTSTRAIAQRSLSW